MGKILFDVNNQVDMPTLILQSKSNITIGDIIGFTDLVYKKSLNSANELSFNVYKYLDEEINPLWDEIKDLKTIYIPEFEEKFQIEVSYNDEDMESKSVVGTALCESELSQIIIRGLEINTENDMKYSSTSTYQITQFYNSSDEDHSLLHRVLKTKANHYTIGHVDDTLYNLSFEFSADDIDIYSFLTNEVAEKCECLFEFDSMTRTINVYDLCSTCQDCYEEVIGNTTKRHYRGDFVDICPNCGSTNVLNGYGKDTTILIDKENLANSITKESNVDSLKNCFYVEGGDDNINAAFILSNPNGSQYIYYFSPEALADMGEPLSTAITEYNEKYENYKSSHNIDSRLTRHVYSETKGNMIEKTDDGDTDNIYVDNYNFTINIVSRLSTDTNYQSFLSNKKDGYIFTGQDELVKELYNAMDLETFIQTSMSPEYTAIEYDKYTALSLLTQSNFGTLATTNLDTTATIINNVIEAKARTIIDTSRYKVVVFNGNFSYDEDSNLITWVGTFQITDRLDDNDETNTITNSNYLNIATNIENLSSDKISEITSLGIPSEVTLYINDDFVTYTKNSIETVISKADLPTTTNVCSCTISVANFMNEIKLYSIDNLKIFYNVIQSCCEVLSSKLNDLADSSSIGYSDIQEMYDSYVKKLKIITGYIEIREENLICVKYYRLLISAYINEVSEELNFQSYLENYSDSENLWETFNYYCREDSYKNDNIISDNLETNAEIIEYASWLMTYAKKEILKAGTPQYTISTDLNNLLMLPEFKPIIEDFEVGNWIHVRTDVRDDIEEELIYKMRLLSYQINFDEIQSINVEFSNVVRTIDCMSDVKSVLDSAKSIATSYNSVYKEVDKAKETTKIVSNWINDSFDLTNQLIKSEGNDQSITIDEHGILARKYDTLTSEYDDNQLKIFSNGLYFTTDNWETVKAGIGKFVYKDPTNDFADTIGYGVIADTIVSNIVCTNELGIYNESGTVKIDENGIYIYGGELLIGDLNSTYARITSDGVLYATGAIISGKIYATEGNIGNLEILSDGTLRCYLTSLTEDGELEIESDRYYTLNANGINFYSNVGSLTNEKNFCVNADGITYQNSNRIVVFDESGLSIDILSSDAGESISTEVLSITENGLSLNNTYAVGVNGVSYTGTSKMSFDRAGMILKFINTSEDENAVDYYGMDFQVLPYEFSVIRWSSEGSGKSLFSVDILEDLLSISASTINLYGDLTLHNKLIIYENLEVSGDAALGGMVTVGGGLHVLEENGLYVTGNSTVLKDSTVGGELDVTGNSTFHGSIVSDSMNSSGTISENSANVFVSSVGKLFRTSNSSKRYKHDITAEINEELDPHKLYSVGIYQYKFNEGYLVETSRLCNKDVIGFIAEDIAENYPIAAEYAQDGDGNFIIDDNGDLVVENWNHRFMIPAMLKLIQEQKQEIDKLKEKFEEMA